MLRVPAGPGETMQSVFDRLNIVPEGIYTIFLNSRLVAARSNMVKWLGYQQAFTNPLAWDLNVKLVPGDRIGIFARDMVWRRWWCRQP